MVDDDFSTIAALGYYAGGIVWADVLGEIDIISFKEGLSGRHSTWLHQMQMHRFKPKLIKARAFLPDYRQYPRYNGKCLGKR
jgi:hypothetical protein